MTASPGRGPGPPGDLDAALEVAILAARRAAAAILADRPPAIVSTKPDGSAVTSADRAADAVIRRTVREAFPADGLLTEEGVDDGVRLASRRCWIADPLDGTSLFVGGSDDFDTFVALAVDGAPAVAVTLQPATGLLVGAVAGRGAWVQAGEGPRRRLALSADDPCRLATKAWLGAPGNLATLEAVARRLGGRLLQPRFSLCPRCFLPPAPAVDAMIGLSAGSPLDGWEWDVAPLDLIVREAGGAVTDLAGAPLRFNQPVPRLASGLIAAATPGLHRSLLAALRGA
jgi:fructose-1,6-bisphosphatase/inositol monophosphatase family enzyme